MARFPLEQRDASKLLLYKGGQLGHTGFRELHHHLPEGALLLFNDTKVIHARLHFELPNGAALEILCLEPLAPAEYQLNFSHSGPVRWKCLVGGNRKWKDGAVKKEIDTPQGKVLLEATRLGRSADAFDIQFEWDAPTLSFGELLALAGIIPLPPYLKRDNVPSDEERYQTVYAREQGSVAAPTAGLHFTEAVFRDLDDKGIQRAFTTLHVGAGTFKPVKAETMAGHHMHEESLFVQRNTLQLILEAVEAGRPIIPVGTTSLRVLESLFWGGAWIRSGKTESGRGKGAVHSDIPFPTSHLALRVSQWAPYEAQAQLSSAEALRALLDAMDANGQEALEGHTQLLIAPGYTFRLASGLITNFHQPRSTLLLLIAAMVGDNWRRIYQYALDNDFRFLSYGDSSLLLP
ncbi:MAG TPA: S-adenosylmethionine:tRNA ribosyltransferase-isomerase [Saprospiraceae bacterium]|nr:S-adenosylmethionine:tRNA ribosyltransferase-isomerase [Saprospiraceae bacterium]